MRFQAYNNPNYKARWSLFPNALQQQFLEHFRLGQTARLFLGFWLNFFGGPKSQIGHN